MKTATYQSKKAGSITIECQSSFITIRTTRLILRSINQYPHDELLNDAFRLLSSPENTRLYGDGQTWCQGNVKAMIDLTIQEWENTRFGMFAVHDKETNAFMGHLHVDQTPDYFFTLFGKHKNTAEIGYILDKAFWGKGYGTEIAIAGKKYIKHMIANNGFTHLKQPLEEIVATAHPRNTGSTNILEKTLKRHEPEEIIRYGHPRLLFYKPLKHAEPRENVSQSVSCHIS